MKLSSLLAQRQALLKKARLANLAFAFERLSDFTQRIARAQLTGKVRLQTASLDAQRYWPALTALEGNQSVIEEHFNEEDLLYFADVLTYVSSENQLDLVFRLEELEARFLAPLRKDLAEAGIMIDLEQSNGHHENSVDCSQTEESS
ncbi:MAG: hypothetical protein QM715_00270 [Nibricoccus sp.]